MKLWRHVRSAGDQGKEHDSYNQEWMKNDYSVKFVYKQTRINFLQLPKYQPMHFVTRRLNMWDNDKLNIIIKMIWEVVVVLISLFRLKA